MSVTRHYCTYFDQRYLPRALALYYSLKQFNQNFHIWALCFDDLSYQRLWNLGFPEVHPISHDEFIRKDDQLIASQENRSLVEYYFTCSPSLPLFVLKNNPSIEMITYLDADLYFFNDPEPLFNEIGTASIAIIPHRFPVEIRHLEECGIYNVGWLTFRRDEEGLKCLEKWRYQCLEWCYDRLEGTKFADQGYLNDWPDNYQNLTIIQHKGANLAPWNFSGFRLSWSEGQIRVDDEPLIFFHFQSLARIQSGIYKLNFEQYQAKVSRFIKTKIYAPYLRKLEEIKAEEQTIDKLRRIRIPNDELGIIPNSLKSSILVWLIKIRNTISGLVHSDYIFPWQY